MAEDITTQIQEDIKEEIKQFEWNMLRDRCPKLPDITEEEWKNLDINKETREFIEEFLLESTHLSPKSLKQYRSALHIFAKWVMENLSNKNFYELKKKDMLRYQNFLIRHGMSSKGIKLKRSAISSMCNYLENYYFGEDSRFDKFRNFVKGVENPAPNEVYKKVLVSEEEYQLIKDTLLEDNRLREYSMFVVCMESGMRGGELIKMLRTEAHKSIAEGSTYVLSAVILGKGRGGGKPLEYMLNQTALDAMKLYEQSRDKDDKCEYLFVTNYNGYSQVSETYFETICSDVISDIVSRRINEHIFRASCATRLLNSGVPEILVSKYVLHHEDLSTLKHYDLREFEEEKNQIFK